MIMNQLNETLRNEAIGLGLCQQWQNEWAASRNTGQLIEMYKRGIDFCMEHKWPTCKWIKSNFDRAELHDHNVFVEEDVTGIMVPNGVAVVRGCHGAIETERNSVTTIHVENCANLTLKAGKFARVFLHIYDNSPVQIEEGLHSTAKVYRHE